ncbi:hypothetical protein IWW38_004847, partial [Coemansia aciculifera]
MASSSHRKEPRKSSSDSLGFEEATFVTSPSLQVSHLQTHSSSSLPPKPAASPLHAPRFPIPAEHRSRSTAVAGTSGVGHSALAIEPMSDGAAAMELNMPGRAGPLRNLPAGMFAKLGDYGEGTSGGGNGGGGGTGDGEAEKPNSDSAAITAAAVAVVTPPAVDEEQWYQEQIDYVRTQ